MYQNLVYKREGKEPLMILKCTWKDSIQMARTEIGCENMDWIQLAQNRVQ
jgi:hypothetical protein